MFFLDYFIWFGGLRGLENGGFLYFRGKMQFSFYFSYFFVLACCMYACFLAVFRYRKKRVWKHYFYYISKRNKYENIFATSTSSARFFTLRYCVHFLLEFNILPFFFGKIKRKKIIINMTTNNMWSVWGT